MKHGMAGGGVGTQGHVVDQQFAAGTGGGGVAMGALMGTQMASHNLQIMTNAATHGKKGLKGKHGKMMLAAGMGGHGTHGYGNSATKKDKKNKVKNDHKVSGKGS